MKYFEGLVNEDEIKAQYKKLAKAHHPDLGGCVTIMAAINAQYETVLTGAYQRAGKSISEIDELIANDSVLREKLNAIIMHEGINVEICGRWIWVTGDTRPVKDLIKAAGFRWAKNKACWFWRSESDKSFNRKAMDLGEIRAKHGSQSISKNYQYKLAGV